MSDWDLFLSTLHMLTQCSLEILKHMDADYANERRLTYCKPPLTFPPFFLGNERTLSRYANAAIATQLGDNGRLELPRSYTIIWHISVVLTDKLGEVSPQARSQDCLSLPGRAPARSLLFLRLTQKWLQKPEVIRSGWKPLLSWPLEKALRGVLNSGLNEDIFDGKFASFLSRSDLNGLTGATGRAAQTLDWPTVRTRTRGHTEPGGVCLSVLT